MLENNDKYFEVLNDIKKTLIVTRNKIVENANKDLVLMYYNIGLKLIKNNKWGSSFIDTLAKDLKLEFPTFGILLCKDKKRVTAELALKDINEPIGVSEYKILSKIHEFLENTLPSIKDIEKRLEGDSE